MDELFMNCSQINPLYASADLHMFHSYAAPILKTQSDYSTHSGLTLSSKIYIVIQCSSGNIGIAFRS
jgi:hypothetical protein